MIEPFVDIDWVEAHRDEVVLADCRWYLDGRSGRAAYDAGHIPGAVFVDLDTRAHPPRRRGRGGPPPARRAGGLRRGDGRARDRRRRHRDRLRRRGRGDRRRGWSGCCASTGHEAALLDGGLAAWRGELETAPAVRAPATFTARAWPAERLATIEEVAAIADGRAVPPPATQRRPTEAVRVPILIDARPARALRSANPTPSTRAPATSPARARVPCRENLDADGRLLPRRGAPRPLRRSTTPPRSSPTAAPASPPATTCWRWSRRGSAAGRLFPGSWSQWSRDPARPAETGAPGTP